jgi:hypothetical protein
VGFPSAAFIVCMKKKSRNKKLLNTLARVTTVQLATFRYDAKDATESGSCVWLQPICEPFADAADKLATCKRAHS